MDIIEKAYKIAVRDLRGNYYPNGIITGKLRKTLWSWDSFFASFGANRLKDFYAVKRNLMLYLKYQRNNGMIAKRISDPFYYLSILRINVKWRLNLPCYHASYFVGKSMLQNPTFVMACHDYIKTSKDIKFLKENYTKIKNAIDWITKQDKDKNVLINEFFGANWSETALKHGEIMFTNVCYYKALVDFSALSSIIKEKTNEKKYADMAKKLKKELNRKFWNNSYYIDWIDSKKQNYFSSTGNVLAIVWGIADKKKSVKIQQFIKKNKLDKVPMMTNYPKYPFHKIFLINSIFGMPGYHNGLSWPWIGCFDAIAKNKMGMKKQAKNELRRIAKLICDYNTSSEVYNDKGKRVETLFYSSEDRFSWTAGMFVFAFHEIIKKK